MGFSPSPWISEKFLIENVIWQINEDTVFNWTMLLSGDFCAGPGFSKQKKAILTCTNTDYLLICTTFTCWTTVITPSGPHVTHIICIFLSFYKANNVLYIDKGPSDLCIIWNIKIPQCNLFMLNELNLMPLKQNTWHLYAVLYTYSMELIWNITLMWSPSAQRSNSF